MSSKTGDRWRTFRSLHDPRTVWGRVARVYKQAASSNKMITARLSDSLKGRWRRFTPLVMKWSGCYDEALRRKRSGYNHEDVVRDAHNIYESTVGSKFSFLHAWEMLRKYPKWESLVKPGSGKGTRARPTIIEREEVDSTPTSGSGTKRKSTEGSSTRSPPLDETTPDGTPQQPFQRPEGVKKAKKKGKAQAPIQLDDRVVELCSKLEHCSQVIGEKSERKHMLKLATGKIALMNTLFSKSSRTEVEEQTLAKLLDWAEKNGHL